MTVKELRFNNETDLFTGRRIVNHSPEHVVQAGLGGIVQAHGLIDHATNTLFGSTIDKSLVESMPVFRSLIGMKTRRGDPIRVKTDSPDFEILGNAPVRKPTQGVPPWTVDELPDGKHGIRISADNLNRAQEIARHALRSLNKSPEQIVEASARHVVTYAPPVGLSIGLGGPVDLRAIAKSCVNALAVHLTPDVVLNGPFKRIRDYVLHGVTNYKQLLNGHYDPQPKFACWDTRNDIFLPLPNECSLGLVDHRLVIRGCKSKGTVYATFELFGNLPTSVLLTDEWTSESFCWGLITNPVPGSRPCWSGKLPLETRPSLSAAEVMLHKTENEKLKTCTAALVQTVLRIAENQVRADIITDCLAECFGPLDGRPITEEMIGELSACVAERIVTHMYRLDSRTEISLSPNDF
jgi:hypothetical protein